MKKNQHSFLHIFMKFTITLNVIIFILATAFFLIHHENILPYVSHNAHYQKFIPSLNRMILGIGISLTIMNIMLFIGSLAFSKKKYFKLLEKVDFDNIEASLTILKNLKNMDEYGFMGEKLQNLLKIYLNFSKLKKKRIEFEKQKFNWLLEELETGALLLQREGNTEGLRIRVVNESCLKTLSLERRSIIIGKDIEEVLHPDDIPVFDEIVHTVWDQNKDNLFNNLHPSDTELRFQNNLTATTSMSLEENGEKVVAKYQEMEISIIPFTFHWPDQSEGIEHNNPENQNSILDSLLILFKKKAGFWKN